jgi:hypothetical protein
MPKRSSILRLAAALLIAPVLSACSSGHGTATAQPGTAHGTAIAATATATPTATAPSPSPSIVYPTTEAAPGAAVPQVRDAFAVLQATYNDSCGTPGNCAYFLNRLLQNLDDLDNSMKASSEGAAHFSTPLTWIGQMQTELHGDFSFTNLDKHQSLLVATRDKVNTWMQSHPEDYR